MKRLSRFEEYKIKEDDMKMFEEWRLLPNWHEMSRKKLSFLKSTDLSKLEPAAEHTLEIKKLWRKIMKKLFTNEKANEFITIVDNSTEVELKNTLEIINKIKDSVEGKKDIGHIIFANDNFHYEKPIALP